MTETASPAKPKGKAQFMRHLKITMTVVVLVLLPAIVMVLVTWAATGHVQGAATWASIPAIVTIAAAFASGRPYAIRVALVMALLAPLSIVAGLSPVSGAALMAVLCLMVGRLAVFGLHKTGLLVPVMIAWPLIDPPVWAPNTSVDRLDSAYLLWMAFIFFVGAMLPALLVPLLTRKRTLKTPTPHSQHDAIVYTVMLTILVAASTYWVLDHPKDIGGAFLIAAIMVMAPLGTAETLKPTIIRVVSTIAGSVLVIVLLSGVSSLGLIYIFGLLFLIVAMMGRLGGKAWLYFFFMVPATAALNATSLSQVGELGKQRVFDNIAGGVLVLLAAALVIGYSNWATRHGHASDADPHAAAINAS
jgi:MFS family permease